MGPFGVFKLHTLNGLQVVAEVPYASYDMGEYGTVVVEYGAPRALADRIGSRIRAVSRLRQDPPGTPVGLLLDFEDGPVGLADLGDALIIDDWPGRWAQWNVSIDPGQ